MKPFPYQLEGIKALASKARFLLRDEPGLGKTCQLILASKVIGAKKILVICPKSMCLTWEREIVKWGADLENFTVINHDKLIIESRIKSLLNGFDVVIADESHSYLKNSNTQRARAFFKVIKQSAVVWLATATVASKSGEDYYCTLKILLPELMKDWNKDRFIKRYCKKIPDEYTFSGFRYEGFDNLEELHKVFSVCSLKRTEEEVKLQLPELTETEMCVEDKSTSFTPEEIAEIKQRVVEGVALGPHYQMQLKESGLNKIPAVIELLNSYPKETNIVIYAWHRDVITKLLQEIKLNCENRTVDFISGEITGAEKRQQIIDDFQSKKLNTLILNMQSGGAGITLTAATKGIYIQFPHSVIHWVQSRKRIHRIGSKNPVQIIKLISKGSIDEEIFSVLNERAGFIKEVEE